MIFPFFKAIFPFGFLVFLLAQALPASAELLDSSALMRMAEAPKARTIGVFATASSELFTDDATGVKIGIPTSLFNSPKIERWGRSWTTADRRISVDTLNFGNTETLQNWLDKLVHKSNRDIKEKFIDKNGFVLKGRDRGRQGTDSLFHVEAHVNNNEIRGLSIVYSASAEKELAPLVQSIVSSLNPFPNRVIAAANPKPPPVQEIIVRPQTAARPVQSPVLEKSASNAPQIKSIPLPNDQEIAAQKKFAEMQEQLDKLKAQLSKQEDDAQRRVEILKAAPLSKPQEATIAQQEFADLKKTNAELLKTINDLKMGRPAPPKFTGNRVALVIGNDKYPNLSADKQLIKAVNDARAMGDVLEDIGFTVIRGENLDRNSMNDRMFDFLEKIKPGDMALVFYAGHGVSFAGGNYVLPTDVRFVGSEQEGRVRTMSIGEADMIAELQKRKPAVAVLMLDACRDNPFRKPGMRSTGVDKGLEQTVPAQGVFAVYSAGFGQSAIDTLGPNDRSPNSIFTRVMVAELYRRSEHLANIMIDVRQEVAKLAKTVEHEQYPAYYDQTLGGPVYVADALPAGAQKGVGGPRPTSR